MFVLEMSTTLHKLHCNSFRLEEALQQKHFLRLFFAENPENKLLIKVQPNHLKLYQAPQYIFELWPAREQ